eukprot:23681-Rhodomonas_salina.3
MIVVIAVVLLIALMRIVMVAVEVWIIMVTLMVWVVVVAFAAWSVCTTLKAMLTAAVSTIHTRSSCDACASPGLAFHTHGPFHISFPCRPLGCCLGTKADLACSRAFFSAKQLGCSILLAVTVCVGPLPSLTGCLLVRTIPLYFIWISFVAPLLVDR